MGFLEALLGSGVGGVGFFSGVEDANGGFEVVVCEETGGGCEEGWEGGWVKT